jgi:hypothetical protein
MRWWLIFHSLPSSVKSQTQLLKTWILNGRSGFLEFKITNISMHVEQTKSSIAWTLNSRQRISNRKGDFREVGVGNWQSSQGSFFEVADEHLALENKGQFWNSAVVSYLLIPRQFCPSWQFFSNRRIYRLCAYQGNCYGRIPLYCSTIYSHAVTTPLIVGWM